jgi:hypothetical protein
MVPGTAPRACQAGSTAGMPFVQNVLAAGASEQLEVAKAAFCFMFTSVDMLTRCATHCYKFVKNVAYWKTQHAKQVKQAKLSLCMTQMTCTSEVFSNCCSAAQPQRMPPCMFEP